VLQPTTDRFRGLARSSPWRWRALAFDLRRRPVHGPEHTVHATVERGVGLEVRLADGERHRDAAARIRAGWSEVGTGRHGILELPFAWEVPVEVDAHGFVVRRPATATSQDPIWRDYQWVAMLDPVELADGVPGGPGADGGSGPGPGPGADAAPPAALDVHRLDASVRHGRDTWWAEVAPREDYAPRCSCCPLLLDDATAFLVALDVATGVCVHVEHLDGDHTGRGFSLDLHGVDEDVDPVVVRPS
jgi:hypothetical protein